MKKTLNILFFVLLITGNSISQKIRVNDFNRDFERYRNTTVFDFVHEEFDTSKLKWVANLTVEFDTVVPGMIGECFNMLKNKANRLGANSYKVEKSDVNSFGDQKFITISTYWIRMEDRSDNFSLYNDNKVYLFGLLGHHKSIEGYPVLLNDSELVVHGLTYRGFDFLDDQKIDILLGSKARGAHKHLHVKDGMRPKFYYFNMVKGAFKNAWISEYKENFGFFLTKILTKES